MTQHENLKEPRGTKPERLVRFLVKVSGDIEPPDVNPGKYDMYERAPEMAELTDQEEAATEAGCIDFGERIAAVLAKYDQDGYPVA